MEYLPQAIVLAVAAEPLTIMMIPYMIDYISFLVRDVIDYLFD